MAASLRLIGADGCPGGWMVALEYTDRATALERWDTFHLGAVARRSSVAAVVVDIPIGLPPKGSRACDLEARRMLGRPRASSVFPAPLRPMLEATTYEQAQRIRRRIDGRGWSRQAHGILARVAEVDAMLRHQGAERVYEGHPELAFQTLADGVPLADSKHKPEGRLQRWRLLRPEFEAIDRLDPGPAASADSLDAYACLWTARRVLEGRAGWLPAGLDEVDPELGVPMRIWY